MVSNNRILSILRDLTFLPNSEILEGLQDYYLLLIEQNELSEEDVREVIRDIIYNEDYFPTPKKFNVYIKDYIDKNYELLSEFKCINCGYKLAVRFSFYLYNHLCEKCHSGEFKLEGKKRVRKKRTL